MLRFSHAETSYLRAAHFVHGTRMSASTLSPAVARIGRRRRRARCGNGDAERRLSTTATSFGARPPGQTCARAHFLMLTIHPCSARLQVVAPPPRRRCRRHQYHRRRAADAVAIIVAVATVVAVVPPSLLRSPGAFAVKPRYIYSRLHVSSRDLSRKSQVGACVSSRFSLSVA